MEKQHNKKKEEEEMTLTKITEAAIIRHTQYNKIQITHSDE